MKSLESSFQGLKFDIEEEPEEQEENITFYLWDSLETTYKIYNIASNYLKEYYTLDTVVLIELIKAHSADMIKILHDIPYIHSGYLSIIVDPPEESNG